MMPEASPPAEPTVAELQRWGAAQLAGDGARRECELLLGHALGRERAWLFAHAHDRVATEPRLQFVRLVQERARGVPVAQLIGSWGFWTLDLRITSEVLVPRPETELLVEAALERLPLHGAVRVADLGTGSGAIALALALERPQARVIATDSSAAALALARANALRNAVHNVDFRLGDWWQPLQGECFDVVASNPPYLADDDPHLEQGDLRFEPAQALHCGPGGLEALRAIIGGAASHLRPGAWLLLEHGLTQGAAVRTMLSGAGFDSLQTLCDLERRERVTLGRWPI